MIGKRELYMFGSDELHVTCVFSLKTTVYVEECVWRASRERGVMFLP